MFQQLGGVFMIVAIVVVASIIIFHRHLPTGNFWVRVSLGLQLGGALGNLVDRMIRGSVVDFVDIGFWPIFNVADLSIVLGVTLLAYQLWNEENSLERVDKSLDLSKGGSL
jgi:signal peptidase II